MGDDDDGDDDDGDDDDDDEQPVLDPSGNPIPANADTVGATVNRSATRQDAYGATVQVSFDSDLAGDRGNRLIVGANVNVGEVDFAASTELGRLDDTRQALPSGFFVEEAFTELETEVTSYSVYFMNQYEASDRLTLTLSGQFNDTDVELRDQLGTALNGDHSFNRFNPSLGATFELTPNAQIYASYAESNRAPSPVELTCADPDDPCRLPNAFLADPPLEQVVAKTLEAGIRGQKDDLTWHLGAFSSRNVDDIIFISAGAATNQGFFDNVGDTSRSGFELSAAGALNDRGSWFANLSLLSAEFDEDFAVSSPNHPLGDEGQIEVERGDRLPGVPKVLAKAGAQFNLTPAFSLGGDVQYSGDRVLRGDEANLLPAVDSFTVFNVRGEYRFSERAMIFAIVENVFDTDYQTFGLLGESEEVLGDGFDDNRFFSPGAPRAAWLGFRFGNL